MNAPHRSHYEALEISRHADQAAIKEAFMLLRAKYGHAQQSKRYTEILGAYAILGNPENRRAYDATLAAEADISLSQATDSLEGVKVTPPSQEEAELSEMELFVCFASAVASQSIEGWEHFYKSYTAHLADFEEFIPCDHLPLLKKCALILRSHMAEKNCTQKQREVEELKAFMAQENKPEILKGLQDALLLCRKSMHTKFVLTSQRKQELIKEIKHDLELFFYGICQAEDTGNHQKEAVLRQQLALVESGLDLLLPGLIAFKKKFYEFIYTIDRTDQTNPLEAIACLQQAFTYFAQRGQNPEEWNYFLGLCDVALEKWGRQKQIIYLQVIAQMGGSKKAETCFLIHLNEDLREIRKLLTAHRLEEVVKRLTMLQTVQENYHRVFNKEMPRFKEVKELLEMYT